MPQYYKLNSGSHVLFDLIGLKNIDDWDFYVNKWETFEYYSNIWIPFNEQIGMYFLNPFPYPDNLSFIEYLKEQTKEFPENVIVYYYEDNESFGIINKILE